MSLPTHRAPSQAIRCGDRNHKAGITRQRKAADAVSPHAQAQAIAAIVRKRIADQQPVPDLDRYRLDDETWTELMAILDADELTGVADAAGGDDLDDGNDDEPSLDEWTAMLEEDAELTPSDTIPPALSHAPNWRDEHPALTHHLQWVDAEGCQHGLTIRCDSLDDLVRQLTQVKALISTAKANAQQAQEPKTAPEPELSSRRCEAHGNVPMYKAISRKTGKPYSSHDLPDGTKCFGRKA